MKLFRQKHPSEDVQLVVAGRVGWKAEKILEKIKSSLEFIHYLNHVTDEQRTELYQKAEVFCVPSFYEGFGMWVLEAFDAGVPVITSKVSSLPEVAGEGAEYCDPHSVSSINQALENVLLNPQRKTQLRELGFQRLQNFSWEKCATETLAQILS
jgi:glycosyltransferase involved in cell wall biosynthesis